MKCTNLLFSRKFFPPSAAAAGTDVDFSPIIYTKMAVM